MATSYGYEWKCINIYRLDDMTPVKMLYCKNCQEIDRLLIDTVYVVPPLMTAKEAWVMYRCPKFGNLRNEALARSRTRFRRRYGVQRVST